MSYKSKFSAPKLSFLSLLRPTANLFGLVEDGIAILATLATVFGIGNNLGGSSSRIAISLNGLPFAFRFILIAFIAIALGWAFGSISARMTRAPKEYLHVLSHFAAFIFAGILVASAEMVADSRTGGLLPQVQFFTFMGLAIILWLCRFQYRSHAQYSGAAVLNQRAIGLLVFTATTVLLLILLELG